MKILINDLRNNPSFDFICDYKDEIKNIDDILDIKPAKFHLDAFFNDDDMILSITGEVDMTLSCAKTLKPVDYHINLKTSIIFGSDEEADYIMTDEIELSDLVFGEIIAEKPYVVYHADAKDVHFEKEVSPHPAFADLDKLFKKS
ncbi:MAG: hypothetical protein WCR19_01955 [Acholeplasmataceae bacterium]